MRFISLHWFHWLVIILSLTLTFGAWYFTKQQVEEKTLMKFDREAEHAIELITERMHKYEDALWSGVAAIHSQSHGIDHLEWKRFSDTLRIEERHPGINGIGVIYHILPENLAEYLAEEQKLRPDYNIHPKHNKDEYWPITYIEPISINAKAVGLDMAHESNRHKAAKKARDTGSAQITAPITLVQDSQKTPGFLFYTPFYERSTQHNTVEERRKNFQGIVYAPFIVKKLMAGTLEKNKRNVGVKISDGDEILYDEHNVQEKDFDPNPKFTRKFSVDFYGRNWIFDIRTGKKFRFINANSQPLVILAGGLIIDTLLLTLFIILSRSNRRSIDLAAKTEETKQAYVDASGDGYWDWHIKDDYEYMSPRFWEMLGYKPEEKEHHPDEWQKVIFEEDLSKTLDSFKNHIETKGKHQFDEEVRYKHKDGSTVHIRCSGSVIEWDKDNNPIRMIGTHSNISKSKEEEKLKQKLMDKLLDSNTELERFAYIASHDLQEPLRMVQNFTELLKKNYGQKLDDKAKEYMDISYNAAVRMQDLVEDLLEYSRIGEDSAQYMEVDCNKVIQYVLDNLHEAIEDKNAQITYDELPTIIANPIRISRVLQNLIGNGLKYQEAGVTPKVHIKAEDKNQEWLFSIEDNGIGMKPEYSHQIFLPFKRLHGSKEYSGTGMGLAICKKILKNLDGTIWVESEDKKGSTFYFTIPKRENIASNNIQEG